MGSGNRRLVLVWAVLVGATLAAIPIGHATDPRPLSPVLLLILLGLSFLKAALVLNDFLDLRQAPAWNRAMRAGILVLLAIIAGLTLIALGRGGH